MISNIIHTMTNCHLKEAVGFIKNPGFLGLHHPLCMTSKGLLHCLNYFRLNYMFINCCCYILRSEYECWGMIETILLSYLTIYRFIFRFKTYCYIFLFAIPQMDSSIAVTPSTAVAAQPSPSTAAAQPSPSAAAAAKCSPAAAQPSPSTTAAQPAAPIPIVVDDAVSPSPTTSGGASHTPSFFDTSITPMDVEDNEHETGGWS